MINIHYYKSKNVGDTLSPIIIEHFTGKKTNFVPRNEHGKLLAVGSIMKALRSGDIVWGAGVMRKTDTFPMAKKCKILAVRGKLSEKALGIKCGVYGDPALLLPLMYKPGIVRQNTIGVIPHYIEKDAPIFKRLEKDGCKIIDVEQDWKTFIDEVVSCDRIISSSLHGIIIAEAYGIPSTWIKVTDNVIGDGFKFHDYITGTGRHIPPYKSGDDYQLLMHLPPIPNLKEIQDKLIKSLKDYYA